MVAFFLKILSAVSDSVSLPHFQEVGKGKQRNVLLVPHSARKLSQGLLQWAALMVQLDDATPYVCPPCTNELTGSFDSGVDQGVLHTHSHSIFFL